MAGRKWLADGFAAPVEGFRREALLRAARGIRGPCVGMRIPLTSCAALYDDEPLGIGAIHQVATRIRRYVPHALGVMGFARCGRFEILSKDGWPPMVAPQWSPNAAVQVQVTPVEQVALTAASRRPKTMGGPIRLAFQKMDGPQRDPTGRQLDTMEHCWHSGDQAVWWCGVSTKGTMIGARSRAG
jgi:hypothetical protein